MLFLLIINSFLLYLYYQQVLLGTPDNSIVVISEHGIEDQRLQDRIESPIAKIAISPNGLFLACYLNNGILCVLSSTFTTKVLDFNTKSVHRPASVTWCGDDAVVLVWKDKGLVMVGPYGDFLHFPYATGSSVYVVNEPDCCRVITNTTCEILQRVPTAIESIRKIGSTHPAALLYDSLDAYETGDPKSDENMKSLVDTNQIDEAVHTCIIAAAAEFDISKQQIYLKAARYGKSYTYMHPSLNSIDNIFDTTDTYRNSDLFYKTAIKIRILNEIRHPNMGIPLTAIQYNHLTADLLVQRLTYRNYHFLAIKICEFLKLNNEQVLIHWAYQKLKKMMKNHESDEYICNTLCRKLDNYSQHHFSYLDMAEMAFSMNRRRLSIMLIHLESNVADQVVLLYQLLIFVNDNYCIYNYLNKFFLRIVILQNIYLLSFLSYYLYL